MGACPEDCWEEHSGWCRIAGHRRRVPRAHPGSLLSSRLVFSLSCCLWEGPLLGAPGCACGALKAGLVVQEARGLTAIWQPLATLCCPSWHLSEARGLAPEHISSSWGLPAITSPREERWAKGCVWGAGSEPMQHEDMFIWALFLPPGGGEEDSSNPASILPHCPCATDPVPGKPRPKTGRHGHTRDCPAPPPLCVPHSPAPWPTRSSSRVWSLMDLGSFWPRSWVAVDK